MIRSTDGTGISVEVVGHGPPLVVVHGTASSAARWQTVRGPLAEHFTLHLVDRRGRAASEDASAYALAREADDVTAVVASIGGEVDVLAHSYGALVALEALRMTSAIRALVAYEPPINVNGGAIYPDGALATFERLLAAGDREGVVVSFFRDVLGADEATLAFTRSLASWPARVAAAHTILREARATNAYRWDAARFANVDARVCLFVGGASHPIAREHTKVVASAFRRGSVVALEGQRHVAMDSAPALFVDALTTFFTR